MTWAEFRYQIASVSFLRALSNPQSPLHSQAVLFLQRQDHAARQLEQGF